MGMSTESPSAEISNNNLGSELSYILDGLNIGRNSSRQGKPRSGTRIRPTPNKEKETFSCQPASVFTQGITVTPGLPRELGIAVGGGVLGLIILLLFLVIVLFIKNRKLKARFERHRVQYVPSPNAEGSDIYEEITDAPQGPRINNDESSLPSDSHQLSRASSLPERDVTAEISLSRNNLSSPGQNKQECGNSLSDYVNRMELTDNAEGDRVNSPGDDGHAHLDHIPDYDDMLELTDNAEGNRVNTTEDDGHAHLDPLPYVNTQGPTGSAEGDKVDSTGDDGHARPDHIPDYFDMLGLTGGTEGDMVYSTLGRQSNP
ncbi:uncharacterized protein [Littorina saxatilis]|uniref:uncharacterized protein isoform X2 n=1 Tax=Littorina saxatilis TaxID=31220 RepID=UPI0038B4F9DD